MSGNKVKIKSIEKITHDVLGIVTEKPNRYNFIPGQATEISINKNGWQSEKRPFTFTCLPGDEYLEFTIKIYTNPEGLTHRLDTVQPGDEFEISSAWGAIEYKGEGVFIAGGAGVTPFISIFRYLKQQDEIGNNVLIFSNKTEADIILKDEFEAMLGKNFINVITGEAGTKYYSKRIDKKFLEENIKAFSQHFYVCGPDEFTKSILDALKELGADAETLVFEK